MAVTVELTGNEQQLLAALKRAEAKGIDLSKAFKEIEKGAVKAGQEASKTWEQTRTPLEKYNRRLEELNQLLKKGEINQDTYSRAVERANSKLKDQATRTEVATGTKAFSGVMALASGYMSLSAGIQMVNQHLQKKIELDQKALGTQTTVQSSRASVIRNMPGASVAQLKGIFAQTGKLATDTGVSQAQLNDAFAQAFSAEGTGDAKGSMDAVRAAAKMLPDRPAEIAEYAGALLDMSKITGSKDAEGNAGFLSQIGSTSRIVSPSLLAKNAPRAMTQMIPYGADAQTAAKLFSAMTVASADVTGEQSGTASIKLAEQLREFLPEEKDLAARLRKVRGDKSLAQDFLSKASFETKSQGSVEQFLLDPTSKASEVFDTARISAGAEGAAVFRDQVKMFAATDSTAGGVDTGRKLAALKEKHETSGDLSAREANSRKALEDAMDVRGTFFRSVPKLAYETGGEDPETSAIRQIEKQKQSASDEQVRKLQEIIDVLRKSSDKNTAPRTQPMEE